MPNDPSVDLSNIDGVFLDRDGVLNRKAPAGLYITRLDEFEVLPGVEDAIAELNRSGRKVVVVTNQRGIALGLYSTADVDRLHDQLRARLAARGAHLDAIYVCPHDKGQCNCRKPLSGMFEQAFGDFPGLRPENSVMIGDSLSDIEAGARLGMRTVLVTKAEDPPTPELARAISLASMTAASLPDFVHGYLCRRQSE